MEVLRADEKLLKRFGQTTFTLAYHKTIKAFHWHRFQDDLWFAANGKILIVLYDLRHKSPTYGHTQILTAGEGDYKLVVIPAGVAHGYKVLSRVPALVFYHTTRPYNPQNPDEERLAFNDPQINFPWHKY